MKQEGPSAGMTLSRRKLLGVLAGLFASHWIPGVAFATPGPGSAAPVSEDLDAFIGLSAVATGVSMLDRETARLILEHIRSEPWGKEHLAQIAAKMMPAVSGSPLPASRQQLLDPLRYTEGERWFIGHLLTTWFTGIYYHQTGNHVIAYRDALMHVALQDVRSIPGHCEGRFGFWSDPPAGASK